MSWRGVGHYLFLPWQLLPPHPGKISRAGVCLLGSADSFQDWEIFADSSSAQQPPRVCVCVCVRSHGTTGFCVPVFRFLALFFWDPGTTQLRTTVPFCLAALCSGVGMHVALTQWLLLTDR